MMKNSHYHCQEVLLTTFSTELALLLAITTNHSRHNNTKLKTFTDKNMLALKQAETLKRITINAMPCDAANLHMVTQQSLKHVCLKNKKGKFTLNFRIEIKRN